MSWFGLHKHHFINLLIAVEALLLLTSGKHRQQFHQIFSQLTSTEQETQKIAQALIIGFSFTIFLLSWSRNILLRLACVILYTLYVCFEYNVVKYHRVGELAVFAKEMVVVGLALVWNIDQYLNRQRNQLPRKDSTASSVTSIASSATSMTSGTVSANSVTSGTTSLRSGTSQSSAATSSKASSVESPKKQTFPKVEQNKEKDKKQDMKKTKTQ